MPTGKNDNLPNDNQEQYEEIVAHVFQYIKMLKDNKVQEWIFDEVINSLFLSTLTHSHSRTHTHTLITSGAKNQ